MEPLFRLMLLRPAVAQDPDNPSIELSSGTALQNALVGLGQGDIREDAVQHATAFANSQNFIATPEANPLAAALKKLSKGLDAADDWEEVTQEGLNQLVQDAFGKTPANVIADAGFKTTWSHLADSLLAIKILQQEHQRPIQALARQLRDMELVKKIANEDDFESSAALRRKRNRSLRLPSKIRLIPTLSTRTPREKARKKYEEALKKRENAMSSLIDKHNRLRAALDDIGELRAGHFTAAPAKEHPGVDVPEEVESDKIALANAGFVKDFRVLGLGALKSAVEGGGNEDIRRKSPLLARVEASEMEAKTATLAPLTGKPAFQPQNLLETGFVLNRQGLARLSDKTKDLAEESGFDLREAPIDELSARLEGQMVETAATLSAMAPPNKTYSYRRVGQAYIKTATATVPEWSYTFKGYIPMPVEPLDGRIPHSKGDVEPAGVTDLILVRQQLTGYEAADVAHIENVLKGERKVREHTRREETEIVTLSETEVSTSEEHELESTDRYEMTKEAAKTLKEDAKLKAGLKVSGKYGPMVEFSASAEASLQRTKEVATKTATTFSQDVTERSARKIAERVLERVKRTTTTETIEKNTHELNNVGGGGHISGVYQWVNKVYEAQMYNYGLRAMFDFMIPEPAAFLIKVMQQGHAETLTLEKPPEFNIKPEHISESNYGNLVKVYGATDVEPPPPMYRTVSTDFHASGGDDKKNYNHSSQMSIEDGYKAIYGSVAVLWNQWNKKATMDIALGRRTGRVTDDTSWLWTSNLDNEESSIPFALDSFKMSQVAVAVEVKCKRTATAFKKWQLETHAKLRQAHMAMVAEYEEKLAQAELQAGVAIEGRNPETNLKLIEDELKKNCVSILTDQHFDLFDAIETAPGTGFEQIDIYEAAGEGAYVRFFEQAFEWENMSWVNYPYFWGRKSQWDERMNYDDPDPVFTDFLKAGYCRVSVPARPGFEGAIDHFLTFGEPWMGGPLPTISSDLYLPIADEIAERLDRPGDEVPQGEPWKVRIPTSLVKLRDDDKLPKWEKDENGEWVEVET